MIFSKPGDPAAMPEFKPVEQNTNVHRPAGIDGATNPADVKLTDRPAMNFRYVDRPDCPETFADSITGVAFDGQTLRIEFAVTRVDEVKPNTPLTGRRYPSCRLVLPPAAAVDLINKMQQVAAALAQAGLLKPTQQPAEPPKGR